MRAWLLLIALLLTAGAGPAQAQAPDVPAFEPLLREELQRLERALDGRMGIALFRTDDPTVQAYISGGILRVPQEAYLRLETGLASVAVLEGKHNDQKRAMCYVLFNPARSGPSERAFYQPIAKATGDARQGAAFLAAHETAHCLDHLEREGVLARHMQWDATVAAGVGLQPDAFGRVFGAKAATAAYRARQADLYSDLAQRQYEERLADAFGVLWVWRMGGAEEVQHAVHEVRARDLPRNAHYTAPVLAALPALKPELAQATGIDGVWALARKVQRAHGVDAVLGPGSTVATQPLGPTLQQARRDRPAAPPREAPRPKAWNALPRFGAPRP